MGSRLAMVAAASLLCANAGAAPVAAQPTAGFAAGTKAGDHGVSGWDQWPPVRMPNLGDDTHKQGYRTIAPALDDNPGKRHRHDPHRHRFRTSSHRLARSAGRADRTRCCPDAWRIRAEHQAMADQSGGPRCHP